VLLSVGPLTYISVVKVKVKVSTLDIAPLRGNHLRSAQVSSQYTEEMCFVRKNKVV